MGVLFYRINDLFAKYLTKLECSYNFDCDWGKIQQLLLYTFMEVFLALSLIN